MEAAALVSPARQDTEVTWTTAQAGRQGTGTANGTANSAQRRPANSFANGVEGAASGFAKGTRRRSANGFSGKVEGAASVFAGSTQLRPAN